MIKRTAFLRFYREVVELGLRPPHPTEKHYLYAAYREKHKPTHSCRKAHDKWAHETFKETLCSAPQE